MSELIPLIPNMTDYDKPSGLVTESSRNGSDYGWRAFTDNSGVSRDYWYTTSNNQWLSYEFEEFVSVKEIYLFCDASATTGIRDFKIVDESDNVILQGSHPKGGKTYTLPTYKKLKQIKIEVVSGHSGNGIRIDRLQAFGKEQVLTNFLKTQDGYLEITDSDISISTEPKEINLPINLESDYNIDGEYMSLKSWLNIFQNGILELVSCTEFDVIDEVRTQTTHELNLLQDDLLQAGEVKILNMHEKGEEFNVGVTFVPDHALLLASGDIKLKSIGNIDYFKVDATATDDAEVKMIVSVDEGETWNAYNGDWHEVEPDADVVLEKGTPAETFNNIPPTAWNELRKFSDTIRFGYLINGRATVHALHSQFDMTGTWKSAYHGEHYDYEYTDNSTMHITLKIDGDYKINY